MGMSSFIFDNVDKFWDIAEEVASKNETGEIKIVTVHPDTSEAIQLTGENIVPGNTIVPKH